MSKLLLTFYGDDFTGSTDALEQLTLAGIRTLLFVTPPTPAQIKNFPGLQVVGVAGKTRSLGPKAMEREFKPALLALKKLGARHVHYKICSTFDSSPTIGNLGCVMDLATKIFTVKFIPLLVAAPALGRYTIFGNHFARYGIGSTGAIHRLDQHPSISKHPVTPMTEADLRLHLGKQTKKKIALFDVLKLALPEKERCDAFQKLIAEKPEVILFDALTEAHLGLIGKLLEGCASENRPLFSVGSSGIEMALAAQWKSAPLAPAGAATVKQILVGSGSCSPVTSAQIAWALKNGFAEVALDAGKLVSKKSSAQEILRATMVAVNFLKAGRSVIVHTTKNGSENRVVEKLKSDTAKILGAALGKVLRGALAQSAVRRVCVAGGDTSSYAAKALGIEALEMIAPLTPGAPLCRALAPKSSADNCEIIFKGGQVGAEKYFEIVKRGKI